MKRSVPFGRVTPLDEPGGSLVGAFAGTRFLAAFRAGEASSVLAEWPGPDGDPEAISRIDAVVVALDAAPDGSRVALAAVSPEHGGSAMPAPVQLLVVDLSTREGDRYLRPEMRFAFAEQAEPRVLFAPDGRFLAVGALAGPVAEAAGAATTCAYVVDVREKKRVAVLAGAPVAWWEGALLLEGEAAAAWSPERDATEPWSGIVHARSPDGAYTLRTTPAGERSVVTADGTARTVPLPCGGWCGPHHLRCETGAFDVRAWSEVELFAGRRERALARGAKLVALAPDGRRAVFLAGDGRHVWAFAEES